jgi:hypothetical protein
VKFHLYSLVSPGIDKDLIPHWIEFYERLNLDSYNVVLHTPSTRMMDMNYAVKYFKRHEWNVAFTGEPFNNDIRYKVIQPLINQLPPDDMVLYPDSDEFQEWPGMNPRAFVPDNFDAVRGRLVDRFDLKLKDADPYTPLDDQYPFEALDIENQWLEAFGNDNLKRYDKICAAKAKYKVALQGLHDLLTENPSIYMRGILKVHHFKWRTNYIERMKTKWYTNTEIIEKRVKEFFNQ